MAKIVITAEDRIIQITKYLEGQGFTVTSKNGMFFDAPLTYYSCHRHGKLILQFSVNHKIIISTPSWRVIKTKIDTTKTEVLVFMVAPFITKNQEYQIYRSYKTSHKKYECICFKSDDTKYVTSFTTNSSILTNSGFNKFTTIIDKVINSYKIESNLSKVKSTMSIVSAMVTCSFSDIIKGSLDRFKDAKNTIKLLIYDNNDSAYTYGSISLYSDLGYAIDISPSVSYLVLEDKFTVNSFNIIVNPSGEKEVDFDFKEIIVEMYNYCKINDIENSLSKEAAGYVRGFSSNTIIQFSTNDRYLKIINHNSLTSELNEELVYYDPLRFKITYDKEVPYTDFNGVFSKVNEVVEKFDDIMKKCYIKSKEES